MSALQPGARDALTETLHGLLPEPWRNDLAVTRYPRGFALQFTDAQGLRHTLEAREAQPEAPALVTGDVLAYSYTPADPTSDVGLLLEEYRAALAVLAAHEADILPLLTAPATIEAPSGEALADVRDLLPREPAAPAALTAILRDALPEPWRREVSATLLPGGYVLRFSDEQGRHHALDGQGLREEAPAFVRGEALGYSYTIIDPTVDELAECEAYRAVIRDLIAREADVLPWLPAMPAPGETPGAEVPRKVGDLLPREPVAPAELTAILRDALPEAWRHAVSTTLIPGGYVLRFEDAEGLHHALDGQGLRDQAPAFVRGHALGYSYTIVDPAVDEPTVSEAYRKALGALATREAEVLPWLVQSLPAAAQPTDAPTDEDSEEPTDLAPAPKALTERIAGLLPAAWREGAEVSLISDGFAVRFADEAGVRHMIEGRSLEAGFPALVRGKQLGFSYLKIDERLDESAMVPRYRDALQALLDQEVSLAADLQVAREELLLPTEAPGEEAPSAEAADPYPEESKAPDALETILRGALPEAWRQQIVTTVTPEGFVLHFRDAEGHQHALDARRGHDHAPVFVTGPALEYSYTVVDAAFKETAPLEEYRRVLEAVATRESEVVAILDQRRASALLEVPIGTDDLESGPRPPPPNEPAPERPLPTLTLSTRIASLLPAEWNHDVTVELTSDGFAVSFADATGVRHTLEGRLLKAGYPALVRGQHLGFSYLKVDEHLDEPGTVPKYRDALRAFLEQEELLAAELNSPNPT